MKYQVLFLCKTIKIYSRLSSAEVATGAFSVNINILNFGQRSEQTVQA